MDWVLLIGWYEVEQLIGSKMAIGSSDWTLILPNCQLKMSFLAFLVVGFAGFLSVYDKNSKKMFNSCTGKSSKLTKIDQNCQNNNLDIWIDPK